MPPKVDALLTEAFGAYEIVEGLFEKQTRLDDLPRPSQTDRERLRLTTDDVQDTPYQLIHRTVATLLEADRYGAEHALMLVQSFDQSDTSFDDYRAFADLLGLAGSWANGLTSRTNLDGISLVLGWASGKTG